VSGFHTQHAHCLRHACFFSALQEYQFRNIQRSEWEPLFAFINSRKIKIENLAEARHGPRGPGVGIDLGDDLDAGVRAARAEAGEWGFAACLVCWVSVEWVAGFGDVYRPGR
jgi:hypothetical protein